MGHYETFVIRLWIDNDSGQRHGEVRHLATGKGLLFHKVEEALPFIEWAAAREQPKEEFAGPDRRLSDFGSISSKG